MQKRNFVRRKVNDSQWQAQILRRLNSFIRREEWRGITYAFDFRTSTFEDTNRQLAIESTTHQNNSTALLHTNILSRKVCFLTFTRFPVVGIIVK